MTLLETTKFLEYIASQQPNVNAIVESGDIFDLNKEEYEQKYSAFCATQRSHVVGLDYTTYSYTLFYVDRLTLDKSNKIEIQSTATEFFHNFLTTISVKYPEIYIEEGTVIPFTERFTAECAGAYMDVQIITLNGTICPIEFSEEVETRLLTFTNIGETSASISMSKVGEAPDVDVRYSLDNGSTWNFFTVDETTIELEPDEKVVFIGYNDAFATSIDKYNKFVTTGDLQVEGDVTSLLNGKGGDVDLNDCAFTGLFEYTTILNTPKLPSLNLAYACYYGMFRNCDKLVLVTELPSINVIRSAYQLMFYQCTSLIQAPSLPAKNVANAGYYRMFDGCSSLTIPPDELPAKIVNDYSYSRMFFGCTSLTKMPEMSPNIIETYGMQQMFRECTSLVDVDLSFLKELTTPYCVALMFRDCTSLETAILPELVSINATYATQQMFYQCTSLKNVSIPKLETITGDYASYYMFRGCTGLQNVDMSLLKTASGSYALASMFYGCTSLLNVSLTSFETASGDYIMQSMFNTAKIEEINMPNLTSIKGVSACDSTFRGPTTYDYTLKRLLLPKLNTLSGTGIGITMCQYRRGLSYVDLSSLTTISNTNSRFESVFNNCTTFYTVKIHPSATQYTTTNSRAILVSATYLRNIEFTTDASTNIYLNWQGNLNFESIKNIFEHCNNDNMNGKSVTFKAGLTVTDDADGTLAGLYSSVIARGCTINNLTINPYTP